MKILRGDFPRAVPKQTLQGEDDSDSTDRWNNIQFTMRGSKDIVRDDSEGFGFFIVSMGVSSFFDRANFVFAAFDEIPKAQSRAIVCVK